MELILKSDKYDLIKKYSRYYIRFMGGQMAPIPCDLQIEDEEKEAILTGCVLMEQVLYTYMAKIPWTENEFIKRGFTDFFRYNYGMSPEEIEEAYNKLEKNKAFRNEMYQAIMQGQFPEKCWAKIEGKTALDYSQDCNYSIDETYMYMLNKINEY